MNLRSVIVSLLENLRSLLGLSLIEIKIHIYTYIYIILYIVGMLHKLKLHLLSKESKEDLDKDFQSLYLHSVLC